MTEILNIIRHYIKDNWYLIFLLIVALLLRIGYPITGHFTFTFDQGKDSLNALEMLVTKRPKLVGPWTSISGLYFGPAWYYFLALCLAVGHLSPAAPVWGMAMLGLVQVILVYKYFGKVAATSVAVGSVWLTITTSAWNPFPLTLVSWGILVILQKIRIDRLLTGKRALMLGLLAALGFHFSSAYAIFYPIIILLCILWRRPIMKWKMVFLTILGFLIPCLPQLLFEVKHDFPEVQAVIRYVKGDDPHEADKTGWDKIDNTVKVSFGEWQISAFPNIVWPGNLENNSVVGVWMAIWVVFLVRLLYIQGKRGQILEFLNNDLFVECVIFVIIPLLGFMGLHFNVWYLLGMAPAGVLLVSMVMDKQAKWWQYLWMAAMIIGGVTVTLREFWWQDMSTWDPYYAQWQKVMNVVARESNGTPYNLYTFRPDIYDYNVQYLVLEDAMANDIMLPVDFSYKPGETAYVPMKDTISAKLLETEASASATIYILDHPDEDNGYFQTWKSQNPDFVRAQYVETVGEKIEIWKVE